jgi:hypothetical protein
MLVADGHAIDAKNPQHQTFLRKLAALAEEAKSAQADPKIRLLQQQRQRQPTAGAA